ncbi:MAG: superoxide dismutase [Chloroflexi bacterium]|nr:superoxide dismutase [Chloroflexota bacterium]
MQRLTGMLVLVGLIAALVLAAAPASVSEAKGAFPSIINLPNGWRPEGIAIGRGTNFYAGSLANGAIYRGDLRTGAGDILVPGVTGRAIAGLYVDDRSNKLFAAGTQSGQAFVFDARTGATLATYQLAATFPSFINDVVVTRDAAYFTDSFQAMLYRVPLGPKGALPDQSAVQRIPLSGDFVQVPGPFVFNSNGIEASSNGKSLLIVNSTRGELYRVDPQTGNAVKVDLGGGSLSSGDGLRLQGRTLYVVRNQLNQIAVVQLASDFTSGAIVNTITDPNFDVPTTIGLFGSSLYAVNARFSTPPMPDTTYTVVRVSRKP